MLSVICIMVLSVSIGAGRCSKTSKAVTISYLVLPEMSASKPWAKRFGEYLSWMKKSNPRSRILRVNKPYPPPKSANRASCEKNDRMIALTSLEYANARDNCHKSISDDDLV